MKLLILLTLGLSAAFLAAQQVQPIHNGKLTSALNANSQNIISLNRLGVGGATPLARLHLVPGGTPTTLADGIRLGDDVAIYRSATGVIKLQGDLQVTGSISGSAGVVQLAEDNIYTGGNTFNGASVFAGATEFQTGFTVADNTVRDAIRNSLDLMPGTDVQAYSARLLDIAGLNPQDSYVIVGNGSTWVAETGSTLRTSLGLGTGNDVTFAAITGTTLTLSGAATISGKLTAAAALSDATGLQLGTAGAWYGSGTGIVTDDPLTANGDTTLGDQTSDIVTIPGVLRLSAGGDASFQRTSSGVITVTGAMSIPSATLSTPLGVASGGLGLDNSAATANQFPYLSSTGTFALTSITALGRSLLSDGSESAMRTRLQLGGAALLNVGTTAGTVAAGNDSRLTDARTPMGSAAGGGSDIEGTYPSSVTIKADAVALGTDTTGNYVASLTAGTGVSLSGTNGAESAVPVINIGQAVGSSATPTFGGMTLTGGLSGTTATLSTSVTTADLNVTGTATFTNAPSFTSLSLESITLDQGATGVGRFKGLIQSRTINVDKDHPQATDTRTGLLSTELFRPWATIEAATTASTVDSHIRIFPAATEYAVPAEFGADTRTFELVGTAAINGITTTADVNYSVVGSGTITGDVSVDNAGAVVILRVPVIGNVTATSGILDIYGPVTGTLTVAGGTVRVFDSVSGAVSVTSGTLVMMQAPGSTIGASGGTTTLRGGFSGALTVNGGTVIVAGASSANVTVSSGTLQLDGPVTGDITCSGGTCEQRAPVAGAVTVSGGTYTLRSVVTRASAGVAVTLSSGTLNVHGGASVNASSATETAISRSGGTWNVWGSYNLRGLTSGGSVTVAARAVSARSTLAVSLTADNQTVTPGADTRIALSSNDATSTNRTIVLSTTGAVLGEIYILRAPSSNACELPDNTANGVRLSAAWTPDANDTLTLEFDGTYFNETSRSPN